MNPNIFREYDIRGHAERDLSDEFALDLGRALGTFHQRRGNQRIALGRDCRLSSDRLHRALSQGLLEAGIHIVDVGRVPSPLLYFSVFHLDLDGGVEITGSHNPGDENGFKMMRGKESLFGDEVRSLRTMIEERDFELPGGGSVVNEDILPAYTGFMKGNIKLARKDLRFAIDAGNGAGGPAAIAASKALGLDPIALLCEMDGNFPVHHPDPAELKNLELLRETVLSEKLEFGIAFDGDADRLGVIDDQGEIIWGDQLMILLSRALLADRPGAAILGEVKCSQTLYDDIAEKGGRPILWKTGHSLIKSKMKEEGALLAGEMSGHIFFADRYYGFDDAIYAMLRLAEIVAASEKKLSEMLSDVPKTFSTPELRVDCADELKFNVVERVLAHYRATHDVVDVDGARVNFGDGWGLVRASNTQPVLVLRFEAQSSERMRAIQAEVEELVDTIRQELDA